VVSRPLTYVETAFSKNSALEWSWWFQIICFDEEYIYIYLFIKVKVNQSHYRPEVPRGFQEVKVPRFRDNGTRWW